MEPEIPQVLTTADLLVLQAAANSIVKKIDKDWEKATLSERNLASECKRLIGRIVKDPRKEKE